MTEGPITDGNGDELEHGAPDELEVEIPLIDVPDEPDDGNDEPPLEAIPEDGGTLEDDVRPAVDDADEPELPA